jgi:succinate dehydrogenase / fumarate reductase, cytochrome b subunit
LAMVGFLVGHLSGNLLIYAGAKAFNDYAAFLHSKPTLIWAARLGLLATVAVHIVATIHLTAQNKAARPQEYREEATLRASRSSRLMILSGLTILAFVVYHILHFTTGTFNDYREPGGRYYLENGQHHAYQMVIDGFSQWGNVIFYAVAMGLLCSHLSHGFASVFQTLGITTKRSRSLIQATGWLLALGLFAGFISIPVSILAGWVK